MAGGIAIPCIESSDERCSKRQISALQTSVQADEIVSKLRVRQALRALAEEARLQKDAGETEEGGFAIE